MVERGCEKRFPGMGQLRRRVPARAEYFSRRVDVSRADQEIEVGLMAQAGVRAKIWNEGESLQRDCQDPLCAKRIVETLELPKHILKSAVVPLPSSLQRITPFGRQTPAGGMRTNGIEETQCQAAFVQPSYQSGAMAGLERWQGSNPRKVRVALED